MDPFFDNASWTEFLMSSVKEKLLEVQYREVVYQGDVLQIKIFHHGKQVWKKTKEVSMGEVEGVVVRFNGEVKTTNQTGEVSFLIPGSDFPQTLYIDIQKQGYLAYDAISIYDRVYYRRSLLAVTALLPPNIFFSLNNDLKIRLKNIKVVQTAFGIGYTEISLGAIREKIKGTSVKLDEDEWVDRDEMLKCFEKLGNGDIWVFHGHTGDMDNDGKTDAIGDIHGKGLTVKKMCQAIKKNPPSVILLSGCSTSDIAAELCKCGAKLVIGYDIPCSPTNAAEAAEALLEALLDEKTIKDVIAAGNKQGIASVSSGTGTITYCHGSLSGNDLDTLTLAGLIDKKPTFLDITNIITQKTQDSSQYEVIVKSKLTDEDGNPVSGRYVTMFVEFTNVSSSSISSYKSKMTGGTTDSMGIATTPLFKVSRPSNNISVKVEANFSGDAEFDGSSDKKYSQAN